MTLIQAQDRLIQRVIGSHPGHRRRTIRSACRELRVYLQRIGTPQDLVPRLVRDAVDMANLELQSDE